MKNEINEIIKEDYETENETESTVLGKIEERTREYVSHLIIGIEECESPIEKMMMVEFNANLFNSWTYNKLRRMFDIFDISSQAEIVQVGRKKKDYRVDFLIEAKNQDGPNFNFIVECDGFEHHSSKEKFQSDRKRDRELLSEGYITIRFSGSEIVNCSERCASEVWNTILDYIENRHKH